MAPPTAIPLDNTIGAFLIGFTISTVLFGITMMQLYLYVLNFPHDKLWIKLVVWTVCILETVHIIASTHAIYTIVVSHFGDVTIFLHIPPSISVLSMSANLISTIVKTFFILRIWSLSKNIAIIGILGSMTLLAGGSYFASTVIGIVYPNLLEYAEKFGWLTILCASLSAATDISISVSLCWLLNARARMNDMQLGDVSSKLVEKVMTWTLETGLLTSTVVLGLAISVGISTNTFIWVAFWLCTCRCYANSMLAVLNGRLTLRSLHLQQHHPTLSSPFHCVSAPPPRSTTPATELSVHVHTYKQTYNDNVNEVLDIRKGHPL